MTITPELTLSIKFEMTEAEAREILIDPAPFQKQMRVVLSAHHHAHAPTPAERAARRGKANQKTAPKSEKPALQCAQCGRKFTSEKRLNQHLKSCPGTVTPAD